MTTSAETTNAAGAQPPVETVTASIDGITVTVPKGTLIIRAAELIGIEIPRFCDHPLLDPVAMCRMCLVEVSPGPPKPQPACAVALADGMEVKTQRTSAMADDAQQGVMEFILANHPLDCPICDKGGECPLQNQAMTNGRGESRFTLPKATFDKPINVSAQVLLDRERCVNCARCTRFADQIAGDPFIVLLERGGKQQVGINPGHPFDSYFSGNTVQICPVGALTSAKYRFRARPFDLVSAPTVCEHCASGCGLRTDYRRSVVMRRLADDQPDVNEEWNCDKGRFAFVYAGSQRLTAPMIRENGELRPASWPEAVQAAATGLAASGAATGVLTGGRLTAEDAFAYSLFARAVLGSDHVDFRTRAASAEEAGFLAEHVAGTGLGVSYEQLEQAPAVVLVGFEPEDESPIVFLRLRKAVRSRGQRVVTIAPLASYGSEKLRAQVVLAAPGEEPVALQDPAVAAALDQPGAVILVGERAAAVPGLLTATAESAASAGAALAWVPRRAGERAAVDAGLLPGLLPGGRPLDHPESRTVLAAAAGVAEEVLPDRVGLDADALVAAILADAASLEQAQADGTADDFEPAVRAVVVGGVDPDDTTDGAAFRRALAEVGFVVSLEQRLTAVTEYADVVLPVADVTQKSGTFIDWEGRPRPFEQVFAMSGAMSDARVLALVADAVAGIVDAPAARLAGGDAAALWSRLQEVSGYDGPRGIPMTAPDGVTADAAEPDGTTAEPTDAEPTGHEATGVRLATWRQLIDGGTLQQGEPYLAAGAREATAKVSAATAQRYGLAEGHVVRIDAAGGSARLAVELARMPDDVVWVPAHSPGLRVTTDLAAGWGDPVRLSAGGEA
jgi:NADH-quinone oxidoreductase subunit G